MTMKIIGRIENIPDYREWSRFTISPESITNLKTKSGREYSGTYREEGRKRIADTIACKYGYTNTDHIGADPEDHNKWWITDSTVIEKIVAILGMTNPIARVQVSEPGHMVPLHMDNLGYGYINDSAIMEHGQSPNLSNEQKQAFSNNPYSAQRVIIFLEDWRHGQGFVWEDRILERWKSGDVLHWDWCKDFHGTFNAGYWPRPIVRISAMSTPKFEHNITSPNFGAWDFRS